MSTYFEVKLHQVPKHLEDEISGHCFSFDATGVMESMNFHQMRDDYAPTEIEQELKSLVAYFNEKPKDEFFKIFADKFTEIEIEIAEQENKDWMEEWKKDFKAFPLAEDYWVVPSWLEAPAEAKKSLRIDPGMAFGTGTHDTTQLASKLILNTLKPIKEEINTGLDVGTGTGILAMLMARELNCKMTCTEIDDDARVVARENFAINEFSEIALPDYQIENLKDQYDFVVANIIDGVLIKLKKELIEKTKVNGYLLLTGILEEREENFKREFLSDESIEIHTRVQQGEWVGYLVRRRDLA